VPNAVGWISLALAAGVASIFPTDARSQPVKLTRIGGAVELGSEISHQETKSPNAPTRVFDRYRFDEAIQLNVEGYALTRQFVDFHLGGTFGLRQEILEGSSDSGNSNSTLLGYDANLTLFPLKPVSLFLFGSRFEDEMVQNFGTDTEVLSETLGATLRFSNRWFPSSVSLEQLRSRSESTDGFFRSKRDETRRFVRYDGNHLSESVQARLSARAEDVDDSSVPPVGDYRIYESDADFSYRWGPYFEKYWRVGGGYFERQGQFSFRDSDASTSFYWDPTDTLSTKFEYDFDRFESSGETTDINTVIASMNHQLFYSVWTNLNFLYDRTDRSFGVRSAYGANGSLNYEKQLPWNSRLRFDFGARYRFEDRDFEGVRAISTGEDLSIDGFFGNFLSNRNVDSSSIEVFESRGGAPLIEGFDYAVDVIGDRTSIDVLPGGTIDIGEVVFVDYVYASDPSGQIARTGLRFGVGWDAEWIALRYEHGQSDEELIKGEDQPLESSRSDAVRIDLNGEWGAVTASANALFRSEDTGNTEYEEFSFGQELAWNPRSSLRFSAIARQTQRNFRSPDRDMRIITAGVSAYWKFWQNSTLRAFGNYRDLQTSDSLDQRDLGFGARARLRFGKIEVTPSLIWTRRERGESVSNDVRGVLRLRRSF
jgi:hypothetical protein